MVKRKKLRQETAQEMNGSCKISLLSNGTMGTAYRELFKLYDLIQNGDARAVAKFLSETPTEINTIIPCKGIGVLHLAVGIEPEDKSRECTELLLKHGGNPNLSNDDGVTPVHIAAIWGRVDNMKLLLGCGGDVTLQDFDGLTARDYATREQQWPVCDYLNIIDELNDMDLDVAYTLELDKILVTTDEVVAEYELVNDEAKTNTTYRKSEIVRTWCDNNSLVVNKLYPTILGETYLLDNEPWDRNITLDLTTDSFKTCLSKRSEVEISGIQKLEATQSAYNNCSCGDYRRKSVYENFSLPGSPKTLTHRNYNSKCTLRSKKTDSRNDSLISSDRSFDKSKLMDEFNKLRVHDDKVRANSFNEEFKKPKAYDSDVRNRTNESLISSDRSLDKAMAVVQNRTNEWLCDKSMNDKGMNTRRSSASSGVSSNYSGGSIVIANVHEEYKYEDKDDDVVLIEKRILVSPIILPVDENNDGSPDQTVLSIASSLPTSVKYDDNTLRAELLKRGFNPGPIQDTTRTLYLKKLQALKKDTPVVERQEKAYSLELKKSLRSEEWMNDLTNYIELDKKVRANFTDPNKKWREGKSKTSFTYLLLDPRMTDNLPAKQGSQTKMEAWTTFVNSIFYVGKGKRSRPYAHLYQALTLWKGGFTKSNDKKIQYILDIWQDKVGVVCLHIFQNVIPAEAYTYEAAMIDVIGLSTLKNLKSGTYYGVASSWSHKERRMLGLYLLFKAMQIFINEGERQLRPDDI